jgi:hypothetical protein
VCGCICVDRGGKFVRVEDARRDHAFGMRRDTSMPMDDGVVMDQQEGMDDIDMELYGATEKEEMDEKIMETTSHAPSTKINPSTNMMDTPNVTFWCMLYAEDGTLEVSERVGCWIKLIDGCFRYIIYLVWNWYFHHHDLICCLQW